MSDHSRKTAPSAPTNRFAGQRKRQAPTSGSTLRRVAGEARNAKWLLAACVALITAGLSSPDARAADDKTSIQILSVKATKSNKEVPDELKSLASTLKDRTGCTGFKIEKTKSGSAKDGDSISTALVGGYGAEVTAVDSKRGRVTLQVKITEKSTTKDDKGKEKTVTKTVLNSKITIDAGSAQIFTFGYPGSGDEKLVVVVSAK